ncbi:MAG: leucine-rich repeat domain-containing protein [Bacteroidales bacterium]|nr:leucine-rich repeat domain-containing protein [Bacteroidales bacterium]
MKKFFAIIVTVTATVAAAASVVLTATSCAKTDELSGVTTRHPLVTINASADGGANTSNASADGGANASKSSATANAGTAATPGTKVYITPDGSGNAKKVTWQTGDAVTLINDSTNAASSYSYAGTDNAKKGPFTSASPLSAGVGDQIYAFYNEHGAVNQTNNSISVSYTGATANDRALWEETTTSGNATNNSLMYADTTITTDSIVPDLKFRNACSIIRANGMNIPPYNSFKYITVFAGNGLLANSGTATLSGTGSSLELNWSDLNFGQAQYVSENTLSTSTNNKWNHLVIPTPKVLKNIGVFTGPLYYVFSDQPLATATSVEFLYTTAPAKLEAGKSYNISSNGAIFHPAAIFNTSGNIIGSLVYLVLINQAPLESNALQIYLSDKSYNGTIIQADGGVGAVSPLRTVGMSGFIDETLEFIPEYMFYHCDGLKYVSIPKVNHITHSAFEECGALSTVFLPKVTNVDSRAFFDCTALSKMIFCSIITDTDWTSVFGGVTTTNIDLVLKRGQTGVSGNTFLGVTFKSISFID